VPRPGPGADAQTHIAQSIHIDIARSPRGEQDLLELPASSPTRRVRRELILADCTYRASAAARSAIHGRDARIALQPPHQLIDALQELRIQGAGVGTLSHSW